MLKIAIQLDHPSKLNAAGDTSLMLIEEAVRRGHEVYFYEPPELSWLAGELLAPLAPLHVDFKDNPPWSLSPPKRTALNGMDVVLMRQDPPFNMSYITATHLLEQLPKTVAIWNNPSSVRNLPEKLSILGFAEFMPPTLISRDPAVIDDFAKTHGTIVAKPLYGYGGRSVFKFAFGDSNLETLLEHWGESSHEPLMWQAFLPEVATGDRRVIFIDGKVEGVIGRTPAQGSIRANMRIGGTATLAELTPRQHQVCNALSPFLKQHGIILAGVDLIGDYLTEINVTSPTGLRAIERLYGKNLAVTFWEKVEAQK